MSFDPCPTPQNSNVFLQWPACTGSFPSVVQRSDLKPNFDIVVKYTAELWTSVFTLRNKTAPP
eukprot:10446882-Ditylum_brightwellii.AAC.1